MKLNDIPLNIWLRLLLIVVLFIIVGIIENPNDLYLP
jgi:hypothetical protein